MDWSREMENARHRVVREPAPEERQRREDKQRAAEREATTARLAEVAEFMHRVDRELRRQGWPGAHDYGGRRLLGLLPAERHVFIDVESVQVMAPMGWGENKPQAASMVFSSAGDPYFGSTADRRRPSNQPQTVRGIKFAHTDEAVNLASCVRATAEWCVRNGVELDLS